MRRDGEISRTKEKYEEKNEKFAKDTEVQMQNFSEKSAKIHQKRLNFESTRLIFKEGYLSASPIDALTQNINIDLRTTR